eukprot:TRINITY_DN21104_c0_g1_i2.p1 TRINITY_DN21104_c0_g1~~TRINITY_DN21104_c0_g1_i2.p1  ORF type:complete len:442 (+),score=166.64 TRINITY_DN21104_c0_g1_i2:97-1422(+)
MAADEDHIKDELRKRGEEIARLREDLWGAEDRVAEAVDRTATLGQSILRLRDEVVLRRQQTDALAGEAEKQDNDGRDVERAIAAAKAESADTLARLKRELTEAGNGVQLVRAAAEEERLKTSGLEAEVLDARMSLDGARRAADRAREELTRAEESQRERQAQAQADQERRGQEQVDAAQRAMEAAAAHVSGIRAKAASLESEIAMERARADGLQTALQQALEKQSQVVAECSALERATKDAESAKAQDDLESVLSSRKKELNALRQQLSEAKRDSLLQTQSIQGALGETLRMLKDNLDETQMVPAEGLAELKAALEEARGRSGSAVASTNALQQEQAQLSKEVSAAESSATQAQHAADEERRAADLEHEVQAQRRRLLEAESQERLLREQASQEQAALDALRRSLAAQEQALRGKLEELRRPLRIYAAGRDAQARTAAAFG